MTFADWINDPANDPYRTWQVQLEGVNAETGEGVTFWLCTKWSVEYPDYLPLLTNVPVIYSSLGGSDTTDIEFYWDGLANIAEYDFAGQILRVRIADTRGLSVLMTDTISYCRVSGQTKDGDDTIKISAKPLGLYQLENTLLNDFYVTSGSDGYIVQYPFSVGICNNVPAVRIGQSGSTHIYQVNDAAISGVSAYINGVSQTATDGGLFAVGKFGLAVNSTAVLADFTCTGRTTLADALDAIATNVGAGGAFLFTNDGVSDATIVAMHWPAASGVTGLQAVQDLASVCHGYLVANGSNFGLRQLRSVLKIRDGALGCDTIPPGYDVPVPTFTLTSAAVFESTPTINDDDVVAGSIDLIGKVQKMEAVGSQLGTYRDKAANKWRLAVKISDYWTRYRLDLSGVVLPDMLTINMKYSHCPGTTTPDQHMFRELKYWLSRMSETRYRYAFTTDIRGQLLTVGNPVLLDLSEIGMRRYASVTKLRRGSPDDFMTEVEVLVDNTPVYDLTVSDYPNTVFANVFDYSSGNSASVNGCTWDPNIGGTPHPGQGAADKLQEDSASNPHYAFKTIGNIAGSIVFGALVKRAGRDLRLAYVSGGSAEGIFADFDLQRGTVITGVSGTAGGSCTATITPCNGGFYRCELRGAAPSSAVYTTLGLRDFEVTAQGSGVQPVYTGGALLAGVEVFASYFGVTD